MSGKRLVIVDYGMGNLRSVQKAFECQGHPAEITSNPGMVAAASHVVLPGVGAFQDAIANLRASGLAEPVLEHLRADRPFLGICLGLQLLFERGHEDGVHEGLGFIPGDVVRFPDQADLIVPHMGWNTVAHGPAAQPGTLLHTVKPGEYFYFVHSYFARPADPSVVALTCDYGGPFTAAISRGNCHATQFHPEKSQAAGAALLNAFANL
jgi:glutamine amidotransferase